MLLHKALMFLPSGTEPSAADTPHFLLFLCFSQEIKIITGSAKGNWIQPHE